MARRGKGIVIDDSTFQKRARALARKLKVDEYDFVKEQTGLLARDVALFTPPYLKFPRFTRKDVGNPKDLLAGRIAVQRDVQQICTVKRVGTIRWAQKTFQGKPIYRGGRQVALGVIDTVAELAVWHRRNQRRGGHTEPLMGEDRYWVASNIFREYLRYQKSNVGIAKSAFLKASLQLGAKGAINPAIKKHVGKTQGQGRMARTDKGAYGLISGRAKGLSHVFRILPMLERNRLIKAVKRLEFIGRAASKKAGFKVY